MINSNAAPIHVDQELEAFHEWMPGWLNLTFASKYEGGRWFALVEEFDIIGTGVDETHARDQALALLAAYLVDHFRSGTPFEATLRRVPALLRVKIRLGTLTHIVMRLLHRPAGRETKAMVPARALDFAGC